jgi:hypothetical protein
MNVGRNIDTRGPAVHTSQLKSNHSDRTVSGTTTAPVALTSQLARRPAGARDICATVQRDTALLKQAEIIGILLQSARLILEYFFNQHWTPAALDGRTFAGRRGRTCPSVTRSAKHQRRVASSPRDDTAPSTFARSTNAAKPRRQLSSVAQDTVTRSTQKTHETDADTASAGPLLRHRTITRGARSMLCLTHARVWFVLVRFDFHM